MNPISEWFSIEHGRIFGRLFEGIIYLARLGPLNKNVYERAHWFNSGADLMKFFRDTIAVTALQAVSMV